MEEVRIYRSVLRKEFFGGLFCMAFSIYIVICLAHGDGRLLPLLLICGPVNLWMLYEVYSERFKHPYITISNDRVIVNGKHGKYEIAFAEVRSFEIEKLRIWGYKYNINLPIVDTSNYNSILFIKDNYQIFPIAENRNDRTGRALDYVGFRFLRRQKLMRKSIKQNFCRNVAKALKNKSLTPEKIKQKIASWLGWAKHSNSRYLLHKILKEYEKSIL